MINREYREFLKLKTGIDLIKKYEGFYEYAYNDLITGGEPITIGYGSVRKLDGSKWKIGDKISQSDAEKLLNRQLYKDYYTILANTIPYWEEMNNNQRGALLSFGYNMGAYFYNREGFFSISKALREKDWRKVPSCILMYYNPGSNVENGLKKRRADEAKLFGTKV